MAKQADTTLRRLPERGSRDFDLACEILDAAKICHVGFTLDEQPYVVPMACARQGSNLLLHGSVASRLMKKLADGLVCCVTVTHLDGIVLARSAFHSSMNYRSVMVFGNASLVEDKTISVPGWMHWWNSSRRGAWLICVIQRLKSSTPRTCCLCLSKPSPPRSEPARPATSRPIWTCRYGLV